MNTSSILAKAIKYALFAGLSTSLLAIPAIAEETKKEEVEKISVTGSRLQKAEFDQAAPVQVLNIYEAVKAGISSVSELLQRTSMAGGQQFDATFNSNSGNSVPNSISFGVQIINPNLPESLFLPVQTSFNIPTELLSLVFGGVSVTKIDFLRHLTKNTIQFIFMVNKIPLTVLHREC